MVKGDHCHGSKMIKILYKHRLPLLGTWIFRGFWSFRSSHRSAKSPQAQHCRAAPAQHAEVWGLESRAGKAGLTGLITHRMHRHEFHGSNSLLASLDWINFKPMNFRIFPFAVAWTGALLGWEHSFAEDFGFEMALGSALDLDAFKQYCMTFIDVRW